MESEEQDFKIDIEKVLRDKAGDKAKFVPKFLVSWLKKVIHQDDMNAFFETDGKGKVGQDFLEATVKYLNMNVRLHSRIGDKVVDGIDSMPTNDGGRYYTIVCNHPLGGIDGVALGLIVCKKWDGRLVYLVNDLLMNLKGLAPLCVPVNKTGSQSRDFPRMVDAAFTAEKNVIMFPAGLCSRRQNDGTIRDIPWKKTFVTKSVQYKRDIIPVYFSGHNSDRFYNIATWCKRLGIKFNLALIYLVDEVYLNAGKTFDVTFGEPIPWQTFDKSKSASEWALWVQDKVYELGK